MISHPQHGSAIHSDVQPPGDRPIRFKPGKRPLLRATAPSATEHLCSLLSMRLEQAFCVIELEAGETGAVVNLDVEQANPAFHAHAALHQLAERAAGREATPVAAALAQQLETASRSPRGLGFEIELGGDMLRGWACPLEGAEGKFAVVFERQQERGRPCRVDEAATIDRLQRESVLRNRFMATIAHELRNSVQGFGGALELVARARDAQLLARGVAIAQRQLQLMNRMVGDLLEVGRIVNDQVELHMSPQTVQGMVANAISTCRPSAERLGHELQAELADEPLWVMADPVRYEQIVVNLLHNAIKFTKPGGRIVVGARAEGDFARLDVKDNGIGLAAEALQQVFDLFRHSRSPNRADEGLGIGLALVRRLAELQGGSVDAKSSGLGRGATFTVRLPLLVPNAGPSASEPA